MALSENARKVFDYVKEHDGEQFTAADIADALDLGIRTVNGIITAAFGRGENKLMERVPAEIEVATDDGKTVHKAVKFIRFTEKGYAFDPDAKVEAE